MSEPNPKCNRCGREIKWAKKTLSSGKVINAPYELDGSEHSEKVGDKWQCKGIAAKPQASEKDTKLDPSLWVKEAEIVQALGKFIINMEERKLIESATLKTNEEMLTVLKLILSKLPEK